MRRNSQFRRRSDKLVKGHAPNPVRAVRNAANGRTLLLRLLIAAAPAYPAGLAIVTLVPAILGAHNPNTLFVAQAEAVTLIPLVVLVLYGASTLPRGLLVTFALVLAAIAVALPCLAVSPLWISS